MLMSDSPKLRPELVCTDMHSYITQMHDVTVTVRLDFVFRNEIDMYILQRMLCFIAASLQRYVFTLLLAHIHSMAAEGQSYPTSSLGRY